MYLSPNERIVVESLVRLLSQFDLLSPDALYHDGIVQLLRRDEFTHAAPERFREVVEVLERSRFLPALAPQVMESDGVQVIIGAENGSEALKDMSVIVSRYGVEGQVGGLLGIVATTPYAVWASYRGGAVPDSDAQRSACGSLWTGGVIAAAAKS